MSLLTHTPYKSKSKLVYTRDLDYKKISKNLGRNKSDRVEDLPRSAWKRRPEGSPRVSSLPAGPRVAHERSRQGTVICW